MPDIYDLRAWLALVLMARAYEQDKTYLRSTDLLKGDVFKAAWEEFGIGQEYPFSWVAAPQLYAALHDLAAAGLIDDFSAIRKAATTHGLPIAAIHAVYGLRSGSASRSALLRLMNDKAAGALTVLAVLQKTSLVKLEDTIYTLTPKGETLRDELIPLFPLMKKQHEWMLAYEINARGLAAAAHLSPHWQDWTHFEREVV